MNKSIEELNFEQIYSDLLELSGTNQFLKLTDASQQHVRLALSGDALFDALGKSVALLPTDVAIKNKSSITVHIDATEYEEKMFRIANKASLSIQEQSINILYISFGILKWKDSAGNEFASPLLLLPVMFESRAIGEYYKISPVGGELLPNLNLISRLSQPDININLPIPSSDENIDEYLSAIARIIKVDDWSIKSDSYLGIFSYAKLPIYEDIKSNEEKIKKHFFLQALSGDPSGIKVLDTGKISNVDKGLCSSELFAVSNADASQLKAILAFQDGCSFVLKGPPGTGKSQTITNIIAQAIGMGKTVLFVAQKEAALNVIKHNLERAKLGDFCLPLYTSSTKKQPVVMSMLASLKLDKTIAKKECNDDAERLDAERKQLNGYVSSLHSKEFFAEKSLIDYLCEYVRYMDAAKVKCTISDPQNILPKALRRQEEEIEKYCIQAAEFGVYHYKESPFFGIKPFKVTIAALEEMKELFSGIQALCREMTGHFAQLRDMAGIGDIEELGQMLRLPRIIAKLEQVPVPLVRCMTGGTLCRAKSALADCHSKSDDYLKNREFLDARIIPTAYTAGIKLLPAAGDDKTVKANLAKNRKILKPYLINAKAAKTETKEITQAFAKVAEIEDFFAKHNAEYSALFGESFVGISTDWTELGKQAALCDEIALQFGSLLTDSFVVRIENGFAINSTEKTVLDKYQAAAEALDTQIGRLQGYFDPEIRAFYKQSVKEVLMIASTGEVSTDRLQQYNNIQETLKSLSASGTKEFLDAALDAKVPLKTIKNSYLRNYYAAMIDSIRESDRWNDLYDSSLHNKMIESFVTLEHKHQVISLAKIREKMSERRPIVEGCSRLSETGILQGQAIGAKKSLRNLIAQTKRLSARIKPCFLMSPISVSTYLPPDMVFDVVIFDEASQISPGDAIGAIYRSKQVIIVGDSEQLPPTAFFKKLSLDAATEDDDSYVLGKSILETGESIMESIPLNWHYRSKFEELIAVCNKEVYSDQLATFTSMKTPKKDEGLEFYYLKDGIYGDGQSDEPQNFGTFSKTSNAINRTEANKIVSLVEEHINSTPDRSLGIVTFSVAQQAAVQSAINAFRRANKSYEDFFSQTKNEPFFVKNLENVQGDERDTIILSVCYGKDATGTMTQNFGPINRDDGYKRLNVAISRSKLNLKVVSSIRGSDIIVTDRKSKGVKMLQSFLLFAETKSLPEEASLVKSASDRSLNYIANHLRNRLTTAGYTVDQNVGMSSYKIDLAVRYEENGEWYGYMLGILFDHDNYARCRSASDRDRLRPEVLISRGWTLCNVWSTEYYINPDNEYNRIVKLLDECKRTYFKKKTIAKHDFALSEVEELQLVQNDTIKEYKPISYEKAVEVLTKEKNYNTLSRDDCFISLIKKFVQEEGPILINDNLFIKLSKFFMQQKVTDGIKFEVLNFLKKDASKEEFIFDEGFVIGRNIPIVFRRATEESKRELRTVYFAELANGMMDIISKNIGIPKASVLSGILTLCGYDPSAIEDAQNAEKLDKALRYLFDQNLIEEENGLLYACACTKEKK